MKRNPMRRLSPAVVNRVMLVDSVLRQFGSRVFYYSPKSIKSINEEVPGYMIEDNKFVRTRASIPLVNGNWTHSTRYLMEKGMGYRRFTEWAQAHQVGIYVPLAFSELVVNKYETYKLVRGFKTDLHPHTENYRHTLNQLKFFLDQGDLVFLKPFAGNKGDGIISVRRGSNGITVKFFKEGGQKKTVAKTAKGAFEFIKEVTGGAKRYVIQQGVDTMRHEGSVFDLRVVMLFDGKDWSWLHEVRYSPAGSDLSNVSQGGISLVTEELLYDMFGKEGGDRVLQKLHVESFGLAKYMDQLHPGELMELAFDFVLDKNESLRLVEVNTKPGLVSVGFERKYFEMKPEQQPLFERWVYPHTESLARFLQAKVDAL